MRSDGTVIKEAIAQKNHHPTVKPIALLKKIIQLFKTPNPLHVLDPFMGSGSMGIACIELGVSYTGVELDAEYYTIAQTRLDYHANKEHYIAKQKELFDEEAEAEEHAAIFEKANIPYIIHSPKGRVYMSKEYINEEK